MFSTTYLIGKNTESLQVGLINNFTGLSKVSLHSPKNPSFMQDLHDTALKSKQHRIGCTELEKPK